MAGNDSIDEHASAAPPRWRGVLVAATPFVLIAGLFALAVARHLGGPAREVARFEAALVAAAPPADVADTDFVALARGPCRGKCAVYEVQVSGSGRVVFHGVRLACADTVADAAIPRDDARRLVAAVRDAGFAAMPDATLATPSGRATATVELRTGATTHRVVHDLARQDVPALLGAIEQAIDRTSGDARWLPVWRANGEATCPGGAAPLAAERVNG